MAVATAVSAWMRKDGSGDVYPDSYYAVSNRDMASGLLYWLEDQEPLASWDCGSYDVLVYAKS